jgi:soluble lytic murein transglycosylase-like protein
MAFPISNKILTPALITSGALLIAAAPPDAVAPEGPATVFACAPRPEESAAEIFAPEALDAVQQVLVDHLSRRFLIASVATERMVAAAHRAAREVGLDPLLVLAVISIESRFNPIAESVMGAKGLMQIIPKYHLDKLRAAGGEDVVFDPESNIHIGARILQEYVYRTGTLEAGLQFYNGAWRDNSAQYAHKVMAERNRLEQVVRERKLPMAVAVNSKAL